MAKFDVTLPEISVETFEHAWLRFELAATAKEWQEDKVTYVANAIARQIGGIFCGTEL